MTENVGHVILTSFSFPSPRLSTKLLIRTKIGKSRPRGSVIDWLAARGRHGK